MCTPGNFEPNWYMGFALQHRCPFFHLPRNRNIYDVHPNEIAAAKFAIDG
jgi:hypothetical protein